MKARKVYEAFTLKGPSDEFLKNEILKYIPDNSEFGYLKKLSLEELNNNIDAYEAILLFYDLNFSSETSMPKRVDPLDYILNDYIKKDNKLYFSMVRRIDAARNKLSDIKNQKEFNAKHPEEQHFLIDLNHKRLEYGGPRYKEISAYDFVPYPKVDQNWRDFRLLGKITIMKFYNWLKDLTEIMPY